jgi:hypothetical protein
LTGGVGVARRLIILGPCLFPALLEFSGSNTGAKSLAFTLELATQLPFGGPGKIALLQKFPIDIEAGAKLIVLQAVERRIVGKKLLGALLGGIRHFRLLDHPVLGLGRRRRSLLNVGDLRLGGGGLAAGLRLCLTGHDFLARGFYDASQLLSHVGGKIVVSRQAAGELNSFFQLVNRQFTCRTGIGEKFVRLGQRLLIDGGGRSRSGLGLGCLLARLRLKRRLLDLYLRLLGRLLGLLLLRLSRAGYKLLTRRSDEASQALLHVIRQAFVSCEPTGLLDAVLEVVFGDGLKIAGLGQNGLRLGEGRFVNRGARLRLGGGLLGLLLLRLRLRRLLGLLLLRLRLRRLLGLLLFLGLARHKLLASGADKAFQAFLDIGRQGVASGELAGPLDTLLEVVFGHGLKIAGLGQNGLRLGKGRFVFGLSKYDGAASLREHHRG